MKGVNIKERYLLLLWWCKFETEPECLSQERGASVSGGCFKKRCFCWPSA